MNKRALTSTGERRIIPKFVIKGGIAEVTGFKRGRNGLKVYYRRAGQTQDSWMLLSEWAKLRRSHKA